MQRFVFLLLLSAALVSCSKDEDESYPPLITEMAMARADDGGIMASFTTDDGVIHHVNNTIKGMKPNSRIRALISYITTDAPADAPVENTFATVYSAKEAPVLWDWSDANPQHRDPTGIQSAWLSGGYINLHLTPKTQGGKQAWGFSQDSVTTNAQGASTHHISLYHDQLGDATSYTTDLYACIHPDSIPRCTIGDSIRLSINTFQGLCTWQFALQ